MSRWRSTVLNEWTGVESVSQGSAAGRLLAHVTCQTLKSTRRHGNDVTIDDQILNRFQVRRRCVPRVTRAMSLSR